MRAALYARVSTEKQERDDTIGSQLAALRQAETQRRYRVQGEEVFRDEGYSGARLDRLALDRLRDVVAADCYDVVLVLAPDRLARHYAYQVVVIDEFAQAGCRVEFLNHAGGSSPEEQMLLQVQGVFAESAMNGHSLRLCRARRHRQGLASLCASATGWYPMSPPLWRARCHFFRCFRADARLPL